jgi:hypothetical protein
MAWRRSGAARSEAAVLARCCGCYVNGCVWRLFRGAGHPTDAREVDGEPMLTFLGVQEAGRALGRVGV